MTVDLIGHGMSRADPESGEPPNDRIAERLLRQEEFGSDLNARGYTDVLVLRRENGRDVLTDSRLALIEYLDQYGEDVESVSHLARELGRDKGAVSKDLRRMAELDIIEYEGDGDGDAKRPMLKHRHVVIEPILY